MKKVIFGIMVICVLLYSFAAIAATSCENCRVSKFQVTESQMLYVYVTGGTWSGNTTCTSPNLNNPNLNYYAISPTSQNLSKYLTSTALTALSTGNTVNVYGSGTCSPFNSELLDTIIIVNQ